MSGGDLYTFLTATLLPALTISWAGGWALRRWAPGWGLVDRPGTRKIHTAAMPTGGGLAIWLGLVLPLAAGEILLWSLGSTADAPSWIPEFVRPHLDGLRAQSGRLLVLMGCGTLLMGLGLWDDLRRLDWRWRLAVQTLVAAVTVAAGFRMTLFVDLPLLTGLVSVLWIVGLVNTFNMLDNMDGLSAGVAAIACSILAITLLTGPGPIRPQLFVAGFLLLVVGSLLGFLWHNRPPARLFMGDAGSYLVGYFVATAALAGTFAGGTNPPHAVLSPLCILAVALYDTVSVVWIRLQAGRSPFVGDTSHFSHRLVDLGMTQAQAVVTIYLAAATCGLPALVLARVDLARAIVLMLSVLLTVSLIAVLEAAGRKRAGR